MRLNIGQFQLPCSLRNLPADIALDRVSRQDDLGHRRIIKDKVNHTRIMVVEIAKAAHRLRIMLDLAQQRSRVRIARRLINA